MDHVSHMHRERETGKNFRMYFEIIGEISEIQEVAVPTSIPDVARMDVKYAVCVYNKGYRASLEVRKVYAVLPDDIGRNRGLTRVIDESGEDYLYPEDWFAPIELTDKGERAVSAAMW